MPATFNPAMVYSFREMSQFYEPDGRMSTLINTLLQDNPILEHARWRNGNLEDGHKFKIVTKLPEPAWRRLYQGVNYTKSGVATVRETCRQFADRWAIDVDEMRLWEGEKAQNAFRMQEAALHIAGMKQFFAEHLFYADNKANPDEFRGFHPRYPYRDAPNVIDAGATTGDTCSIWAVVWAENADGQGAFCLAPKNSKTGIRHRDLGVFDAFDEDNKPYAAVGDEWKWDVGFGIGNWKYVARICNIPVDKLNITDPSATDYVNLREMMIDCKNKIAPDVRKRVIWYVPNCVQNALEKQAIHPTAVHLRYGEFFKSEEVLKAFGRPVFECDALLDTESPLPAAPVS